MSLLVSLPAGRTAVRLVLLYKKKSETEDHGKNERGQYESGMTGS